MPILLNSEWEKTAKATAVVEISELEAAEETVGDTVTGHNDDRVYLNLVGHVNKSVGIVN